MSAEKQLHLLDDLQSLLERQIEAARRSNFHRVEALAEQAESIVEKIDETGGFGRADFDGRREGLTKLYKKLELMLTAAKDGVAKQLRHIGEGRRTLRAYRTSGKFEQSYRACGRD